MIPATRGEHVHVWDQGAGGKKKPLGYRLVGYELDDSGAISGILIRNNNGDVIHLADLEASAQARNKRVEIVTFDWIGCCNLQDDYAYH